MSYLMNQIQNLIAVSKKSAEIEPYHEVLESITLTGNEVFITDWFPNYMTSKIQYRTEFPTIPSTVCFTFGARDLASSAYPSFGTVFIQDGSVYKLRLDNTRTSSTSSSALVSVTANTEYFFEMYNRTFISNGSTSSGTGDAPNQSTLAPFCLGTTSWRDGTVTSTDSIQIGNYYYKKTGTSQVVKCLKCYDDMTNLVHDYIPVLNDKMQPCLYDKVTKTFAYAYKLSDGTTTYDLGFKRWKMYEVDYIENTGTSYIPFTDITPSATMGMNIEYAYTVLDASEPAGVIGTYNGDTQRKDTFFVSTSSGSTKKASSPSSASCGVMVFHRGGNVGTSSSSSASYIEPEKDVWYKATVNWLGDGEITWTDGTNELSASVGENSVMTNQLRLFSRCNSSNNTYNNCKSIVRKLQFSDGSNIIRSYKPVVWHNGDTTAIATLYDEVYNKMCTPSGSLKAYITNINTTKTNVFTTTGATSGKAINAEGTIINSSASSYSDLLPIVGGTVIECVSGDTGNNNYRYHCYDSSGTWIEQSLVLYPEGAGTVSPITGSFTAPLNAKYVRVSYATQASSTIQVKSAVETIYEVGSNCFVTPSTTSNYFNSGLYGNEKWNVKLIAFTSTNVTGQLFGVVKGSQYAENLTINAGNSGGTGSLSRFDSKVTTQSDIIKMGANEKALLQICEYGLWQDNTCVMAWSNPDTFTTETTCFIGKVNGSTGIRPNGCCYLAIEEDNVLIAEFIPVKNKTVTTETGLYDRVSGTLNTGVGTHTFNSLS